MQIEQLKARYLFGLFKDTDNKNEIEFFYKEIDKIFELLGNTDKLRSILLLLDKIIDNFDKHNVTKILFDKLDSLKDNNNTNWYEWKIVVSTIVKYEINDDISIQEFLEYEKYLKKLNEI